MSKRVAEVAVVGGGIAALCTAFELTRPEHNGRFAVTLYQRGWRLGGKGASSRGADGRIEEHGLHLFLGYYENAFRLLRECYAELGRDPRHCRYASCFDAFYPDPVVTLADDSPSGDWKWWTACFPTRDELPGDPENPCPTFSLTDYLVRSVGLLDTLLRSVRDDDRSPSTDNPPWSTGRFPHRHQVEAHIAQLVRLGRLASITALFEALQLLECGLSHLPDIAGKRLLPLIDLIAESTWKSLEALVRTDDETRRLWVVVDLVLAFVRGAIRFDLLSDPRGLDALDEYDAREWLRLAGVSKHTLDSTLIRSLYNLGFAYHQGDTDRPSMAAGQFLRGTLRMFLTYRGSLFWKMRAGMGEVVFAPLYEVLAKRGVCFRFFHRLENVEIATDTPSGRSYVGALEFDVQAEVHDSAEYSPLIEIDTLPCWPSEPDWSQLDRGETLRQEGWDFESFWDTRRVTHKRLEVVRDFDFVVLGVSLGAIPHVARELVERDPRWRAMVEHVGTVATQACQLWLRPTLGELGWQGPRTNLTGFVEPFDTWANMDQLISEEGWDSSVPGSIAYFCGVLPTPEGVTERSQSDYPSGQHEELRRRIVHFLNRDVAWLWPNSVHRHGGFRWDLLTSLSSLSSPEKSTTAEPEALDTQFWRANIDPSDRYVLSLPGTQRFRISPLDNTYDNLTLAGDWTDCGHNQGCVESAVISGRLAAHALAGWPSLEDIDGYDHP